MKLLFLSDINSAHTRKWAISLAGKGIFVAIFSLNKNISDWYKAHPNIEYLNESKEFEIFEKKDIAKIAYLQVLPGLKKYIKTNRPDILHAHYASSYGLLGALTRFHPFILSVWGSDVYEFPTKSFFHKLIFKRNLRKADRIFSTSNSMAEELKKYTKKEVSITPFGIDIDIFKHHLAKSSHFQESDIVIGTIKALEPKYGINYLIDAFDLLCKKHANLPLKLLIVGKGTQELALKDLACKKGIENKVIFTGWVNPEEISTYHNMLDIFAALSDRESFGVAVLEASACGKPVVVSDVSGFKEVVENGVSGLIVPRNNAQATANALEKLVLDKSLRISLGAGGRKRVEKYYNWNSNLEDILKIYNEIRMKS